MREALKILSWVCVILGALAVVGALLDPYAVDSFYSFVGGGLFLAEGWLALKVLDGKV